MKIMPSEKRPMCWSCGSTNTRQKLRVGEQIGSYTVGCYVPSSRCNECKRLPCGNCGKCALYCGIKKPACENCGKCDLCCPIDILTRPYVHCNICEHLHGQTDSCGYYTDSDLD